MISRLRALALLSECTGVDIWSVAHCQERGVPQSWIDEFADAFESGYASDRDTIYHEARPVNQYHGIHDLQLAFRLGEYLGIDVQRATATALSPTAQVRAIQEAVDEI